MHFSKWILQNIINLRIEFMDRKYLEIAEKYGEKWGDALVAQAHKYCDANFIQWFG